MDCGPGTILNNGTRLPLSDPLKHQDQAWKTDIPGINRNVAIRLARCVSYIRQLRRS